MSCGRFFMAMVYKSFTRNRETIVLPGFSIHTSRYPLHSFHRYFICLFFIAFFFIFFTYFFASSLASGYLALFYQPLVYNILYLPFWYHSNTSDDSSPARQHPQQDKFLFYQVSNVFFFIFIVIVDKNYFKLSRVIVKFEFQSATSFLEPEN